MCGISSGVLLDQWLDRSRRYMGGPCRIGLVPPMDPLRSGRLRQGSNSRILRLSAVWPESLARARPFLSPGARFAARCPLPLKTNGDASDVCFLVMPFFTEQRDAIVSEMLQRGIPTYFRY